MISKNELKQILSDTESYHIETVSKYPYRATRELLMNAIMHRDYETNAPVQFYEYDDRIEVQNPGGLYGKVSPDNFPNVSDYRNPFIA